MTGVDCCRFGVNYTPSKDWWYCWNDFDADSIRRDLDAVASLNADHIRIMALWTFFQPNPSWVSPAHLERLDALTALAEERGLDVCVSMLTGHLTGQNFKQGYERGADFFTDKALFDAQSLYFSELSKVLNKHGNFLGFDIGNELNCCWSTEDLAAGDAWHRRILALAESLSPGRVHSNGVDHQPWFRDTTFSPACLASSQSIVPLHCWILFTGAIERAGRDPLHPRCLGLVPAMAALARSYAADPAKPVWCQEYGASEEWMDKGLIPEFLEKSTLKALEGGVAWFTWWASHDIDRKFKVNPLEYTLGLIGCDNKVKPQGESFARLAAGFRGRKAQLPKVLPPPPPQERGRDGAWPWIDAWLELQK